MITVLGPLPPRKGISQYMYGFIEALTKKTTVQLIDFSNMYPRCLYPGGDPKQKNVQAPKFATCLHQPVLVWYNPFSRIKAGVSIQGEVFHMQYRIWFLAPIYITVGLIAKYYKKIPTIITIHNVQPHEKSFWKLLVDKAVYAVADRYIVHSQENKTQLEQLIGQKKPVYVLPHGIIVPNVQKIDTLDARKQLHISSHKKVLLFFGMIRPYKGLHSLLEALPLLLARDNNYLLIIAGKCREDRQMYQKIIDRHHLADHILTIDKYLDDEEVNQVFCASDMLILPYTHFDAHSGVVALGLGYEIPMIVSNLGGLTEVIDDDAYIWRDGQIQTLANCIDSCDIAVAKKYVAQKAHAFNRQKIIDEMMCVYKNSLVGKTC